MAKAVGFLAAAALAVGMVADPAAATMGAFTGTASVAQGSGSCGIGSPGLGLPIIHGQDKNGHYGLTTPVVDIFYGAGTLYTCGWLTSFAGVGAACGMSKGYDGVGSIVFYSGSWIMSLSDVGWKFSAGGTFLVTGDVTEGKDDILYALVHAEGGAPCLLKKADYFTVVGTYYVSSGGPKWNDITDLVDPKNDGSSSPTNPWGDKE